MGTSRIVQFAATKIWPHGKRQSWEFLVNPGFQIPPEASAVHGITDADVATAPTFKEISGEILSIFEDSDIAGFNIKKFDMEILLVELDRIGVDMTTFNPFDRHYIDVYQMYTRLFPKKLSSIYTRLTGEELNNAHDALADVNATIVVFEKLLEQYPELPKTAKEMDSYCSWDVPRADISGKFYLDIDGQYRFAFGMHKNKLAKEEFNYVKWMFDKGNFAPDTKEICFKIIKAVLTKKGLDEV